MNLCNIYNFAPHYREPIFRLMDEEFQCAWYFGKENQDIKKMSYEGFRGPITEVETLRLGGYSWQRHIIGLLWKYDCFLVCADSRCLSNWVFLFLAKFFPRKKVYLWGHGFYGKETKLERVVKKAVDRLADGIFLYNNYARNLMISLGFKRERLFVIYNSLDYPKQCEFRSHLRPTGIYSEHFGNSDPNLIFIGRLASSKKLDLLLDAQKILKQRGHNYNMTFIGGGEELSRLKARAEKDQLNVWFYGPCYDELLNGELIYNADLCVSPGNVGLTAIHSMTFGTPVLTHSDFSHQGPEFEAIIPSKTGDFFQRGDVEDMISKIEQWLEQHSASREDVRKACFDEIAAHWNPQVQLEVLKKNLE